MMLALGVTSCLPLRFVQLARLSLKAIVVIKATARAQLSAPTSKKFGNSFMEW